MIRANIEAEIDSLECRIANGLKEVVRLQNLINKQCELLNTKDKEVKDLMDRLEDLKEQLND